jgi:choline kinase
MTNRAIILSAGQGSRLLPLTADDPKCLIEFSGKTLLDWQIDALIDNGVDDIIVVTGFREHKVSRAIAARPDRGARIRTLFNPFYQVADNLGTVWMAREYMDRDFLLLNGDTLIAPSLVRQLLSRATAPITVTVDEKPSYDDDDMKVRRDGDRLMAIGKTLGAAETNAESIGMLLFRGSGSRTFVDKVEAVMRTPEGTSNWYLKVIDRLASETEIGTVSIKGHRWGEVDFPADLDVARALTAGWAAGGEETQLSA